MPQFEYRLGKVAVCKDKESLQTKQIFYQRICADLSKITLLSNALFEVKTSNI